MSLIKTPAPFIVLMLFFATTCKKDSVNNIHGTMTDQEGNVYHTIVIGNQTWMVENLRTTKYRDGSEIPEVTTADWQTLSTGAFCNYKNTTSNDTIATYGRLYNWYAVTNNSGLAPKGWHIPTDSEWTQLTDFLDGEPNAGGKLKEAGTTHWNTPNTGATNEASFTALPGGYRSATSCLDMGVRGVWWSATENNASSAFYRRLYFEGIDVTNGNFTKSAGFSIRCIKD